jgi:threonylcarbamoyladenosine tRNA methylthiotransferase MtaB
MSITEKNAPRFLIQTLGCKVNQYDSEKIRTQLLHSGYQVASGDDSDSPDLIIVNTCSVTAESDRKGRQMIRKLIRRHPNARVMVTGCYSERKPEEILKIDGVNELVAIEKQAEWVQQLADDLGWGCDDQAALWDSSQGIELFHEHTRAFVKIQDGCDLKCTFCSIPQGRGKARSRPMPEILDECRQLVHSGYPEIVFCGICLGYYGRGMDVTLPDLLRRAAEIDGIKRIRISSFEPQHANDDLFQVMQEKGDVICPHLHLPLQSGSNRILRRMNRLYKAEYFMERVQTARDILPHFELSTDIMVGFPGETDQDFQDTIDMVNKCEFCKVHAFRFSAREDTPALRMSGKLEPQLIEERRKELDRVAGAVVDKVKKRYIGSTMPVLVESVDAGHCAGFTINYLRVEFDAQHEVCSGDEVSVEITDLKNGNLVGNTVLKGE